MGIHLSCLHCETGSRVGMRYVKEPGFDSENMAETVHPYLGAIRVAGAGERNDARADEQHMLSTWSLPPGE